jgi:hypothetical protein
VLFAFQGDAALVDVSAEAAGRLSGEGCRATLVAVVRPLSWTVHLSPMGMPWLPSVLKEDAVVEGAELCRRVAAALGDRVSVEMRTIEAPPDRALRSVVDGRCFDSMVCDRRWMRERRFRRFASGFAGN